MELRNIISEGQIVCDENLTLLNRVLGEIAISNDPLKTNYTHKGLDLQNHLAYTMLMGDDDSIICMSGLYHRPTWAPGVYRISNRTWVNPIHRKSFYTFENPRWVGPYQIMLYHEMIKFVFISREHPKSLGYFRALQKRVPYYRTWTISDRMMQVVPGLETKAAYQYIIHRSDGIDSCMNSITEEEWHELPH